MATEILSNAYIDGVQYMPTCFIPPIRVQTDNPKVEVSLSCEDGSDGDVEVFFATTLYPFDGIAELDDAASLIEGYFRKRNKVAGSVSFSFDGVSATGHFLYCEYDLPDAFDPNGTFFLASKAQRVHQDSTLTISAADRGSVTPFVIKAVGHKVDSDEIAVVRKSVPGGFDSESSRCFHVGEIVRWALNLTDDEAGEDLRDVLYFSIEYAGVQKMFYIVPAPAYLTFTFRNMFNVMEYVDVAGVVTTKTEVSRDTAVCYGSKRQYDRLVTRTYEVQTEPLTSDEVALFEQFVASHQVTLYLEGNYWDVIVTDHTCEPNSDDESLASVKFTWAFARNRPRLFDTDFDGIMPSRRKIFDDTFSPEYE